MFDDLARRLMAVFFAGIAAMGWTYLSMYLRGQNPVTADTFGPMIYVIPGWAWAVWQGVSASAAAAGFWSGSRRGVMVAGIGAFLLAIEFTAFGFMASQESRGAFIVMGVGFLVLPFSLICIFAALGNVRDG